MELATLESRYQMLLRRFDAGEAVREEVSALEAELRRLPEYPAPERTVEASLGAIAATMRQELKFGPLAVPDNFPELAEQVRKYEEGPVTTELLDGLGGVITSFAALAKEAEAENRILNESAADLERDRDLLAGYRELLDNL